MVPIADEQPVAHIELLLRKQLGVPSSPDTVHRADVKCASATTVPTVNLDAVAFSDQWVAAWNAHDVESVLQHFHEDVLFTSPVAARFMPESAGVVHGKSALRDYWTRALQRIPNLRFVVEAVYQGIDTIVIVYRNQDDDLVSEVLRFTGDLVIEGHGTYLAQCQRAAGDTY